MDILSLEKASDLHEPAASENQNANAARLPATLVRIPTAPREMSGE